MSEQKQWIEKNVTQLTYTKKEVEQLIKKSWFQAKAEIFIKLEQMLDDEKQKSLTIPGFKQRLQPPDIKIV